MAKLFDILEHKKPTKYMRKLHSQELSFSFLLIK